MKRSLKDLEQMPEKAQGGIAKALATSQKPSLIETSSVRGEITMDAEFDWFLMTNIWQSSDVQQEFGINRLFPL